MSFTATDHHWCRRGRQLQQFHILHYSIINLLIHLPQQLNKVLSIIYLCSKFIHFRDKSFIFSLQCFIDKLQLLQRATKINILHYCYHNYNIVTKLKLPTSLHQVCQCYQQFFTMDILTVAKTTIQSIKQHKKQFKPFKTQDNAETFTHRCSWQIKHEQSKSNCCQLPVLAK